MANKTIIVLGDTHVPDLLPKLPDELLRRIRAQQPELILHTGDVSSRKVLQQLGEIAPVLAVQGNRDFFFRLKLPQSTQLEVNGITIGIAHGHFSMWRYLVDLFRFMILQHQVDYRYYQRLMHQTFPKADLILYGHTHIQIDEVMDGQRFLNPGSVYPCKKNKFHSQFAILRISSAGDIYAQLETIP